MAILNYILKDKYSSNCVSIATYLLSESADVRAAQPEFCLYPVGEMDNQNEVVITKDELLGFQESLFDCIKNLQDEAQYLEDKMTDLENERRVNPNGTYADRFKDLREEMNRNERIITNASECLNDVRFYSSLLDRMHHALQLVCQIRGI